ncbi:MAG: hypothetical protein KF901_03915 [Myxococcales bacterium]|nr:hypothetical protein [Myxococcales bacterium]
MHRGSSRITDGARFLNVDLDLRGPRDVLDHWVEALRPTLFVLEAPRSAEDTLVRLELCREVCGAEAARLDTTLAEILDAISRAREDAALASSASAPGLALAYPPSGPDDALTSSSGAPDGVEITLSIGVDASPVRETSVVIAPRHLVAAARLGCALELTIYPATSVDVRAEA